MNKVIGVELHLAPVTDGYRFGHLVANSYPLPLPTTADQRRALETTGRACALSPVTVHESITRAPLEPSRTVFG
jgi:hypothetical protein